MAAASARIAVQAGETAVLVLDRVEPCEAPVPCSDADIAAEFDATVAFWRAQVIGHASDRLKGATAAIWVSVTALSLVGAVLTVVARGPGDRRCGDESGRSARRRLVRHVRCADRPPRGQPGRLVPARPGSLQSSHGVRLRLCGAGHPPSRDPMRPSVLSRAPGPLSASEAGTPTWPC